MEKAPASADEQTDKQKAAAEKTVYLTFDDGPGKHTPEVLELLRKAGVRATFFMLGEYVDRYPGLARKVAQSGHAIGNHTYDHVYKELYGSFDEFAKQVTRTDDSIYKATGIRTPLVRAPGGTYGNFDAGYFEAIEEAGYIVHDWNVDSGDSKAEDVKAKDIVATIKGSKLADKLVVLLHDGGNHSETVKALPAVISYYKNKGYRFAVLTEDTEPVRFSLAKKLKWTRPAVTGRQKEFLVREAADRGHGQAAEADRAAAGAMESGGEAGAAAGTGGTGTAGDPQQSGGGNGSAGGEGAAQGQRAAQGTGGDGSVGAVHSGGEAGAAAGTGGGPAQGGANGTTGGKGTEAAASDPRLVLHFEGKAADFEAGQYRLAAGVLQAPLEGLMKAVGGSAAYDPESGVYKAGLGGIVRTWEPQSEESRDGLMVPIRTLFAEFGIRIYRLTMTADVREIWAEYAKR